MKTRQHILDELKDIAPTLSQIEQVYFPAVPEGYLENFPAKMVELVEAEMKPVNLPESALRALRQQLQQEVPANYFSNFSAQMLKKVQRAELSEIAPALSAISYKEKIEVPAGYFVGFPEKMLRQTAVKKTVPAPAWIRSLNNFLDRIADAIFTPQLTFAVAGLTSVAVVAMLLLWTPESAGCKQGDLLCQLEKVDERTIDAYMLSHYDEFGESVLETSTDESEILNRQQFDAPMLQEITDDELNAFVD